MVRSASRILVVDDHPLCATAVGAVVGNLPRAFAVETARSIRGLADVAALPPLALVLLDLRLPDATGTHGIDEVMARFPDVPVCVLSGMTDPATIRAAIGRGVAGFIPKTLPYAEVSRALTRLLDGERVLPRLDDGGDGLGPLSPAERRIMAALSLGLQNKQIAWDLGLSESTVKSHLAHVFAKLRVTNRSQAILAYERLSGDLVERAR